MEDHNHVYLWKRLYWEAIQAGYEPQRAEAFANHMLSTELKAEEDPATGRSMSGGSAD